MSTSDHKTSGKHVNDSPRDNEHGGSNRSGGPLDAGHRVSSDSHRSDQAVRNKHGRGDGRGPAHADDGGQDGNQFGQRGSPASQRSEAGDAARAAAGAHGSQDSSDNARAGSRQRSGSDSNAS